MGEVRKRRAHGAEFKAKMGMAAEPRVPDAATRYRPFRPRYPIPPHSCMIT